MTHRSRALVPACERRIRRPGGGRHGRRFGDACCRPPHLATLIVCILSLALGAMGCGYRFAGYDATQRNGEPRRIAVVTLENDSYEPGVELVVSQALRHEILGRGGLALVDSGARPDYTLRGRVLPVRTRSRSFTGDVLAREYEVTLRFEIRVDEAGGPGLDDAEFSARELYLASADAAVLRKNRQEALRYLGGLLARRVHDTLDRELLGVLRREP